MLDLAASKLNRCTGEMVGYLLCRPIQLWCCCCYKRRHGDGVCMTSSGGCSRDKKRPLRNALRVVTSSACVIIKSSVGTSANTSEKQQVGWCNLFCLG